MRIELLQGCQADNVRAHRALVVMQHISRQTARTWEKGAGGVIVMVYTQRSRRRVEQMSGWVTCQVPAVLSADFSSFIHSSLVYSFHDKMSSSKIRYVQS